MTQTDLNRVKKNITRQAMLAGLTVVLTIVILFAMTSAWYTNVVQNSNLVFQAESWGFDGDIEVGDETIIAGPGDVGVVSLDVQNKSQNISAISLNVSKAEMDEEMQKRLYLYVDTHMNRDDETMDRVYLNSQEGYTYTVFSNGSLTLSEKGSNAPQLKWQWVYDVLGYYVLAQSEVIMDADDNEVQKTTIYEYLRPIEYDYDEATTILKEGEDGEMRMVMTTVDGTQSPENFLKQLSLTDGYQGQIDPNKKTADGYYPVAVDEETGYGVYAYLCTYKEIQDATELDTKLGNLAAEQEKAGDEPVDSDLAQLLESIMKLIISAQKNESTAINVANLDSLQKTIASYKADVIQLSDDIEIPADKTLTIPANTRVMVDLNGKTITCHSARAIDALSGSSLTMINGDLVGPGSDSKTYGIYTTGAEVVMSAVDVTDFQYGVFMGDNVADNPLDSRVHMVNCKVDAGNYGIFINGNGLQSAQKTQLIIEDCIVTSGGIALTCNGSTDRAGTDIQIKRSTIKAHETQGNTARGHGIYHPQKDSTMWIVDSTVSGYCGIIIKGGAVTLENTKVYATGAYQEAVANTSGFTDTGDAVYVETSYGYDIQLEISGSETLLHHDATESKSLHVFPDGSSNVSVTIYSGTFDEAQPESYIAEGSVQNGSTVTVQK